MEVTVRRGRRMYYGNELRIRIIQATDHASVAVCDFRRIKFDIIRLRTLVVLGGIRFSNDVLIFASRSHSTYIKNLIKKGTEL